MKRRKKKKGKKKGKKIRVKPNRVGDSTEQLVSSKPPVHHGWTTQANHV